MLRCSRLADLEFGGKLHDGVSFLPGQAKDLTAGPARQRSEETVENLSPYVNHVEPSRSKLGVRSSPASCEPRASLRVVVPNDLTTLHDERHALKAPYVLQRITIHGHKVSPLTGFDAPDLVVPT